MANQRKKNKKMNNELKKIEIGTVSCEINYDKLAEAIVKAQELEKSREEDRRHDQKREWQKSIGIIETNNTKMGLHNFLCIMRFVLSFGHNKKSTEKYKSEDVIFGLSQTALSLMYKFIQWIGYILVFIIGFKGLYDIFHDKCYIDGVITFIYAFLIYIIAKVFDIASYESLNIKDKHYLMSVLSATTCLLSFIVAVVTMIISLFSLFKNTGSC